MKKHKLNIFFIFIFSALNLHAGLFYDEKSINKNEVKNNNNNNKNIDNFDISKGNFQETIDSYFSKNNYNQILKFLEFIASQENIKPEDKQLLYNYVFDEYINIQSNKETITFEDKQPIITFLYQIVGKLNPEDRNSGLNIFLFKIIEGKEVTRLEYIKDYEKKFYMNGIDNSDFFIKIYRVLNSPLTSFADKRLGSSYLPKFSKYLNNAEYSENLHLTYLKYCIESNYFNTDYQKIAEKIVNNNKFSSDGYYYLALHYKKQQNQKKYEENIQNAIKYNKKNAKAFADYIHYCVDKKYKLDIAIKLANYYFSNNYNEFYNDQIRYDLGLAYFKSGGDLNNYDMILKSYFIFKELNKTEYIGLSKNILKMLDKNRYMKDIGR